MQTSIFQTTRYSNADAAIAAAVELASTIRPGAAEDMASCAKKSRGEWSIGIKNATGRYHKLVQLRLQGQNGIFEVTYLDETEAEELICQ